MKDKKKLIIGVSLLSLVCVSFIGLLVWNTLKSDNNTSEDVAVYESKQLKGFTTAIRSEATKAKDMSNEAGRQYMLDAVNKYRDEYYSDSVIVASKQMESYILTGNYDFLSSDSSGGQSPSGNKPSTDNVQSGGQPSTGNNPSGENVPSMPSNPMGSISDLIDGLDGIMSSLNVDNLLGGLLGNDSSKTISLKSNTACKSVADQKYCVNLSANVYITDANSKNWVVLVHPFMTSGAIIYNSIGGMYQEQGYNVIAPDLRGFGNSGGSVAMGYLESLDIYDWIKDLNSKWNDASRYGVNVAPSNIIVHGISLGGATTLQLATNPDIAAANGNEPYTKNLTQLNVKGFVDDCGYTSMSGVMTGMLGGGVNLDTLQLSSLLDSLGIEEVDFMSKMTDLFKKFNIEGFEDLDLSNITSGFGDPTDIIEKVDVMKEFMQQYSYLDSFFGGIGITGEPNNDFGSNNDKNNPYYNGKYDMSGFDWNKVEETYGGSYNIPSVEDYKELYDKYKDSLSFLIPQNNNENVVNVVPVVNSSAANSDNVLDGIIGTALMNLVGIGLTEENYNKYSNVFSSGRKFPSGAKVVIIHGTADAMVLPSNSDTVANNVSPAKLIKKWDVSGASHAFILMGTKKNEYSNLVASFTDCVEDNNCNSIK